MFEKSNVCILTDDDFNEDTLKILHSDLSNCDALVMFYSPSCPHCVNKEETMSKLADYLNTNVLSDLKFKIAAANVYETKNISSKLNITSIPTFFIYINGELKQDKEVAYDILKSVQE